MKGCHEPQELHFTSFLQYMYILNSRISESVRDKSADATCASAARCSFRINQRIVIGDGWLCKDIGWTTFNMGQIRAYTIAWLMEKSSGNFSFGQIHTIRAEPMVFSYPLVYIIFLGEFDFFTIKFALFRLRSFFSFAANDWLAKYIYETVIAWSVCCCNKLFSTKYSLYISVDEWLITH